jgi:16S rRNA (guanine(966)-N(2))-methyltransferase RsmD
MSSPRIISGTAGGLRLQSVPGDVTRPITDRVKEALFNILGADIEGASFLDLFGGTGSVGIEALSRGAKYACFIDKNRKAYETIKANLDHTSLDEKAEVILIDAFVYLKKAVDRAFDYIYVAPPQYKNLWFIALQAVDAHPELIAPDGWVIVQIDPTEYRPIVIVNLKEFNQRRYGDTLLIFYR